MLTAFQHFLFVCLSILFSPPDLVPAFSAEGSRPSHRAAACLPSPSAIPSASMGQSLSVLQGLYQRACSGQPLCRRVPPGALTAVPTRL